MSSPACSTSSSTTNKSPHQSEWKFTKNDLDAPLERIAAHDHADRTLAA